MIIRELRDQLLIAQNCLKRIADKSHREVDFQVGDLVYLKLQPYRQRSLAPYPILQGICPMAYKLQLPTSSTIHSVSHVSLLKQAMGPDTVSQPLPPILTQDME